ncbi:MAG: Ig-like domain-containing protein, partial [Planctomycetota bacterium]|nr:Ig-like domain-containing protein [Planctomycetota bacterium]
MVQRDNGFAFGLQVGTVGLAMFFALFAGNRNVLGQLAAGLGPKGELVSLEFESADLTTMIGENARKQLIVTGLYSSGQRHDLTHDVTYSVDTPTVLDVDAEGLVVPTADGTAKITARVASGQSATLAITTAQCAEELPVNFENEIVPIFTKLG